jgi:hypothetical protein
MRMALKVLTLAALTMGGAATIEPTPAEAQGYRVVRVGGGGGAVRFRGGGPGFVATRPRGFYRGGGFYGPRYGWRGGYRPAAYGPRYGWRGGYRPAYYGGGYGWGGGYRRAYYGPRYGYYGYYGGGYPYGYYRRSYDGGGAVVAGLIGGLALGAIANAATQPYYRPAAYPAYSRCFFERRRIVTRNGNAVVRRVRTCY